MLIALSASICRALLGMHLTVGTAAGHLIQTPYGELLILTQVRVMGSYNRIGTIKLSKANLESLVTPE